MVQSLSRRRIPACRLHLRLRSLCKRVQPPSICTPRHSQEWEYARLTALGLAPDIAQTLATKVAAITVEQRRRMEVEMRAIQQAAENGVTDCRPVVLNVERRTKGRKLVVFDLDETLIYSSFDHPRPDYLFPLPKEDGGCLELRVKFRPHAQTCLRELSRCFELAVFTASTQAYAQPILDLLDPTGAVIAHRLYRESCVEVGGLLLKDLTALQGFGMGEVMIVDNSATGLVLQRSNGVPINSWHGEDDDSELLALTSYLRVFEGLADVRTLNWAVFSPLYETMSLSN